MESGGFLQIQKGAAMETLGPKNAASCVIGIPNSIPRQYLWFAGNRAIAISFQGLFLSNTNCSAKKPPQPFNHHKIDLLQVK